jgi:hypothetical protein
MTLKQLNFIWLFFFIIYLSPLTSYGQFEKGNKIIGGNFALSYQNSSSEMFDSSNRYLRLSPTFGYFLSEKTLIGISPTLSYSVSNSSFNSEAISYWGGGSSLFLRRFFQVSDKFQFYLEPNIGYHQYDREIFKDRIIQISLSPGLAYLVSDKFWLEAKFGGLGYQQTEYGSEGQVNTRQYFHAGISSYSTLGLFFILK